MRGRGSLGAVATAALVGGLLLVPASSAAGAASVAEGGVTFANTAPISIPGPLAPWEPGPADPFPSPIEVAGLSGVVTDVNVLIPSFSHGWPPDVNIVLESPSGTLVALYANEGSTLDAVGFQLGFDDEAAAPLPTPLVGGYFRPTTDPLATLGPAPAPLGPFSLTLASFDGETPNGTWNLYVYDDSNGDTGSLSQGWELEITSTATFSNPAPVVIPESGAANPFPSTIDVTGVRGVVTDVNVLLPSFSHSWPWDVSIVLGSPDGTFVVLYAPLFGTWAVSDLRIGFDDEALNPLPLELLPSTTGYFRPTTYPPPSMGPPPSPQPPFSYTLASLDGEAPNGTWSLYVYDSRSLDAGQLGEGWSIELTTTGNRPSTAVDDPVTVDEDSGATEIDVLANDTDPDPGDALTVVAVTQPSHGTASVAPSGAAVLYTPDADFHGTDSFTYTMSDGLVTDTATVQLTVDPVADLPRPAADVASMAEDGPPLTVDVLANDIDPDGGALTVTAVTQPANGSVSIAPGGTGVVVTPAPDFSGTLTFAYTVTSPSGSADATVTVTVTPVDDAPRPVADRVADTGASGVQSTVAIGASGAVVVGAVLWLLALVIRRTRRGGIPG